MTENKTEDRESEAEMLKWAKAYARKHGLEINPDAKQAANVIRGLVKTKSKFGRPYCPCRIRSGDEEKDRAIECPCVYHRDEITRQGHCHCNLFYKPAGP